LTKGQLLILYEHTIEREDERRKFLAAIHGVKLESTGKYSQEEEVVEGFLFGDPSSYEHMSKEEKKDLTAKMMGKHKKWYSEMSQATMKGG
jgi:cell division protein YceG involved in septum cleavage